MISAYRGDGTEKVQRDGWESSVERATGDPDCRVHCRRREGKKKTEK